MFRTIRSQLLNSLSSGYTIQDGSEWQQTPTLRSLEELGRQMKAAAPTGNTIHSKSDLKAGFVSITYKREDILKQLEKNCFKGRFVTAIGYSEWDQSRWDQSAAEKRTLINTANFCLTCLDDPATISSNRDDLKANRLSSVVLHSSDAHRLDRVGETMLWVKADPTFARLKQLLNEPDARVFIGTTPPNYKPDHKVIKEISIPASNGWFANDFMLDLNRDLATIIGGRGSGKSALAEAIAYGAGSMDETDDAFLKKAARHKQPITGTKIILKWSEGPETENEVGDLTEDRGLVQYLPQGAVEELCSTKNSEKLQTQIENVIFQALDETKRMGASDFGELRARVSMSFQYEKEQVAKKIRDINHKLNIVISALRALPDRKKLLEEKRKELDRLNKSLPELPPEDKAGQEELAQFGELKKKFETQVVKLQGRLGNIVEIETKVSVFKSKIKEFKEDIDLILKDLAIADSSVFDVSLDEEGIKATLENEKSGIADGLQTLKQGEKNDVAALLSVNAGELPFDNLQTLTKGIEEKEKATRAFETTKLKYQQQKRTILSVESSIKALDDEIARTKSESAPEKDHLEKERLSAYSGYFALLKKEQGTIKELYRPLQESLLAGTETDKKLVFEAQINYRLESHYESGLNIIDRTRKGNFREIDSLKKALIKLRDDASRNDFEDVAIGSGVATILQDFTSFEGKEILIEEQLRESYGLEDFYNWLFDPTYYEIISSLKFDDTDLSLLSQGQKGIVLMMLYLEIDKEDYRPLIIDQPEENLDNLSVYKDLIEYFRDRKQYRQIIMVTHNPNLVVNTDAEQIVVANYDGKRSPRLEYCSGSLEDQAKKIPDLTVEAFDDGIIEQVCNILEGGELAFAKRKKVYQVSTRSQI